MSNLQIVRVQNTCHVRPEKSSFATEIARVWSICTNYFAFEKFSSQSQLVPHPNWFPIRLRLLKAASEVFRLWPAMQITAQLGRPIIGIPSDRLPLGVARHLAALVPPLKTYSLVQLCNDGSLERANSEKYALAKNVTPTICNLV